MSHSVDSKIAWWIPILFSVPKSVDTETDTFYPILKIVDTDTDTFSPIPKIVDTDTFWSIPKGVDTDTETLVPTRNPSKPIPIPRVSLMSDSSTLMYN